MTAVLSALAEAVTFVAVCAVIVGAAWVRTVVGR